MKEEFWQERWQNQEIGFHKGEVNPVLLTHWSTPSFTQAKRVLVPLCGKTLDLLWLVQQGHQVIGVELSSLAVDAFFTENDITPNVSEVDGFTRFEAFAGNLVIYCGDFFALTESLLGEINAVYDRAALVALPTAMREQYVAALLALTNKAPQLLATYDYDQSQMDGPPFAVSPELVNGYYDAHYDVALLATNHAEQLRDNDQVLEQVWRLERI